MAPGPGEGGARLDTNVLVAVRCRPFNSKEKASNEPSCVRIHSDQITLVNPIPNGEDHNFGFDLIFDENSKQEDVWKEVGLPILNKALNGYNGTIFAYGQTGRSTLFLFSPFRILNVVLEKALGKHGACKEQTAISKALFQE